MAATNEYGSPQSIDASLEDAQLIDVAGDSMVLVVAGDHTPKPDTDLAGAIMLTALELGLDGFEFRSHTLIRSDPPDGKSLGLVALPQGWVKPKKLKVFPDSLPHAASAPGPRSAWVVVQHLGPIQVKDRRSGVCWERT